MGSYQSAGCCANSLQPTLAQQIPQMEACTKDAASQAHTLSCCFTRPCKRREVESAAKEIKFKCSAYNACNARTSADSHHLGGKVHMNMPFHEEATPEDGQKRTIYDLSL